MRLSRESVIIVLLCLADLASTLYWIGARQADEANPVFAHYLAMGPAVFIAMKLLMIAAPVFLFEWALRHRPRFTRRAAQFTIAAYLALYVVAFYRLNGDVLEADHEFEAALAAASEQLSNVTLDRPAGNLVFTPAATR